jgi:AAA-like domain
VTQPPRSPESDEPPARDAGRAPDPGAWTPPDPGASAPQDPGASAPQDPGAWTPPDPGTPSPGVQRADPLDVDAAEVTMVPRAAVAVFQGPHPTVPAQPSPAEDGLPWSSATPSGQRAPRPPSTWPLTPHNPPANGSSAGDGDGDGPLDGDLDEIDLSPFEHLVKPADPPAPSQRPAIDETANLPESVGGTPFAGHPPTAADGDGSTRDGDIPSQPHGYADGPVAARVVDHIDYAYEVDNRGPVDTVDDEALVSDDAWFAGVDAPPGVPMNRRARTATPALPAAPDATPASSGRELVPADLAPPSPPSGKTAAPKTKDRDPAVELAISEVAGHLTFTPSSVTAWYALPEVRWAFRPDAEREALISAIAEQYASLAGFRLHLRRTTRPFPIEDWARTVDRLTPSPLPDVPGAGTWADHLVAAQHHLHAIGHSEGQTYLGVTFARRSFGATFSERISHLFGKGVPEGERKRMARTVVQFDEVLGAFGMRGRRATAHELEWLLYRSVALGMAPPDALSPVEHGDWEQGDLLALTEQIERYRTPYGTTVKLVNRLTGEERHVAVLSVGRMEPLEIPERHEPWLHFHERLPWPTEISSRVDILGPGDSFRNLEHRLRMIRSQQLDYAEHGMDAPPELERLAQRALRIGDEMTTGLPVDSSRAHGWHRIAISGATREECLERARRLTTLYARELRIALQHPKNQDWLAREFIPGEPVANTGYVRRMPTKLLAAALPQAASNVGDRRGDLIGRTAGTSRRPVFVDLHFPMEIRERSGLAVFVAEPGGGKSTLLGALGYLAARRGVQVTLLDPSGPLARLAAMPELAPHARVLNLTGSDQGTLAPYALIPTPLRQHFEVGPTGDREYEIGLSNARAERRMLVQDICAMLVPPQVARESSTATLLRHAVRSVRAEETSTLDDIVRCLAAMGDDAATELAHLLLDTAEMPLAMLFFGSPPPGLLGADAALTVITMAGLRLPDLKIEREYWSAEEALALPMLHTAHRLAVRRCYGGSMHTRKLVGLDEGHFMEGWRSGRSFLVRLARDSRKWNLAALVASQNPRDILGLDVQNLVSTVFVGRIASDPEIAAEALRMLRVPTDVGYEETLASLSTNDGGTSDRLGFREFVMRDVDGRVQKIRVDMSYVPDLLGYLDTTPTASLAGVVRRGAEPA